MIYFTDSSRQNTLSLKWKDGFPYQRLVIKSSVMLNKQTVIPTVLIIYFYLTVLHMESSSAVGFFSDVLHRGVGVGGGVGGGSFTFTDLFPIFRTFILGCFWCLLKIYLHILIWNGIK